MKKYFLLGLIVAIAPGICLGAGARYTQLVREKQRKMAELEKCMGATNGLKIAGISTLGLTAVGVAGNIAEAKKHDEYDANIKKAEKKITSTQQAIDQVDSAITQKKDEIAKKKANDKKDVQETPKKVEKNNTEFLPELFNKCDTSVGGWECDTDTFTIKIESDNANYTVKREDAATTQKLCDKLESMYGDGGSCWQSDSKDSKDTTERLPELFNTCDTSVGGWECDTDTFTIKIESDNANYTVKREDATTTQKLCDKLESMYGDGGSCWKRFERYKNTNNIKLQQNCEHDDLGKWENGKCTCTDNYVLHTSGFCVAGFTNAQKCTGSGGTWENNACKCPSKHKLLSDGVCHSIGQVAITATPSDTNDNTVATVDNNNNNPKMLKNVVERDIAAIEATEAKNGAKIYLTGYSIYQLPESLREKLELAEQDFIDRCSDFKYGEKASNDPSKPVLTEDYILSDTTTRYVLLECIM